MLTTLGGLPLCTLLFWCVCNSNRFRVRGILQLGPGCSIHDEEGLLGLRLNRFQLHSPARAGCLESG